MTATMRILSLSQPWLWSIDTYVPPPGSALEPKRIENRKWKPPAQVIADREPIAFHSAKSWDEDGIPHFIRHGIEHPARRELYETGLISCVVVIDDVIDCRAGEIAHGGQKIWLFGPFGWCFGNAWRLPRPIPWKGGQGIRRLPPQQVAEINEQLATLPCEMMLDGPTTPNPRSCGATPTVGTNGRYRYCDHHMIRQLAAGATTLTYDDRRPIAHTRAP